MAKELRFGVIGAGYMGKAYAIALSQVSTVFQLPARSVLEMLATSSASGATASARAFGFRRATGDWKQLVADPDVDVVGICTPTFRHKEMALAAIAAGKHVLCEKPLALSVRDASELASAAERAGVKTLVGYNYIKNPATQLARQMIAAGEIGEVVHFRGTHNEDYLMDPASGGGWRLKEAFAGRAGALGDLASHIVNLAHYLCGPVAEVIGASQIVHGKRPGDSGQLEAVENDDQTQFLLRFASGVPGSIEASRIAAGGFAPC
jgi:predicted dehydrogenase